MTGSHVPSLERHRSIHQEVELDLVIAGDAGMGSAAVAVLPTEVVDDVLLELPLHVEYVMGNPQRAADHPGVFHVVKRAASLIGRRQVCFVQAVQFHGYADNVEPLPL